MTELHDRIAVLDVGLRSLHVDLMTRMDRLQDGMTAAREEAFVNAGAANSLRRSTQNVREELAATNDAVSHLSRGITRIETDVRELKGGRV